MTERHIVCWDYGVATSDTAWGSWETPSAPHVRHAWEPIVRATTGDWCRQAPAGMEHWRHPLGGWADMVPEIWRIRPGESTRIGYPALTPVALAKRCIRLSTWPGEVATDPFAGSGTTLVAAKRLGRREVGVERPERCCGIAAAQLAQQVLPVSAGVA
jgi:site-specific DNA-methyltransferase (adenine-specific)